MTLTPRTAAIAAAAACAAMVPAAALGTINLSPGATTSFPVNSTSGRAGGGLTAGSDGNIWYAASPFMGAGGSLQALTPGTGAIVGSNAMPASVFPPPYYDPSPIVTGPDGGLWFLQGENANPPLLGHMTLAGAFSADALPAGTAVGGLVSGPDGNLWIGGGSAVLRVTPQGTITSFPMPAGVSQAQAIAVGSDGAIWFGAISFAQPGTNGAVFGRIAVTGGDIQVIPAGVDPRGGGGAQSVVAAMAQGPGGVMWGAVSTASFASTENNGGGPTYGMIASVTTAGAQTVAQLPNYGCQLDCTMFNAPDGNEWLNGGDTIMRVSPSGGVTQYPIVTKGNVGVQPTSLTLGPDRNFWFTSGVTQSVGVMATLGGNPIPAPPATVMDGFGGTKATRGKPVTVVFQAGAAAAGTTTITLTRGSTSAQLWKGNVRPGTVRQIKVTVPKSFPSGTAIVRVNPPKAAGRASAPLAVKAP